ncbi:MAG TPA: hypothetical protein VFI41_09255, partial [Gemmatimonadales bacterium]|nr:hypothetical protein [Gemmatimonadales bacterium]
MSTVPLADIVAYLDDYLRIREVPDHPNSLNGLEVENRTGTVDRIVAAVDGAFRTAHGTARADGRGGPRAAPTAPAPSADGTLLIVHHGMFWDGNVPVTGRRYRRLRVLMDNNVALYA